MKTIKRRKKNMLIAIIIPVGIVALLAASVAGGFSLMKHEYSERTQILAGAQGAEKKALVVYQPSVTSASSDVAHAIAQGINDSGYEVKLSNPGKHLSADISDYAVIVFGMPNYGGSVVEALSNYIKKIDDFSGKRVILFSTSGRTGDMPELEKLSALIHGAKPYKAVKYQASEGEKNKASAYQLGVDAAGL
jgi:flavodoxin